MKGEFVSMATHLSFSIRKVRCSLIQNMTLKSNIRVSIRYKDYDGLVGNFSQSDPQAMAVPPQFRRKSEHFPD